MGDRAVSGRKRTNERAKQKKEEAEERRSCPCRISGYPIVYESPHLARTGRARTFNVQRPSFISTSKNQGRLRHDSSIYLMTVLIIFNSLNATPPGCTGVRGVQNTKFAADRIREASPLSWISCRLSATTSLLSVRNERRMTVPKALSRMLRRNVTGEGKHWYISEFYFIIPRTRVVGTI